MASQMGTCSSACPEKSAAAAFDDTPPPAYTESALTHAQASPEYEKKQATEEDLNAEEIKLVIIAGLDVSSSMNNRDEAKEVWDPLSRKKKLVYSGPKRIEVARQHLFELILWASKNKKPKPALFTFGSEVTEIELTDAMYDNLADIKEQSKLSALLNSIEPNGCTNLISFLRRTIATIIRTWSADKSVRFYVPIFTDGTPYLGANAIPKGFTEEEYIEMEKMRILNLMAEFASNTMTNELKMVKDSTVAFQFIQIGEDALATKFLTILDDYLGREQPAEPFEAFMVIDDKKVKSRMQFIARYDTIDTITPKILREYESAGFGDQVWTEMMKHAFMD